MTDANRRKNIADEVARAELSLRATRTLIDTALASDAISRAYYAAYHMLRAVLFARGIEPKTHAGAIHLFNTELVRTGVLPSSYNRLLAGLQRSRELADYDAAIEFSIEDARAALIEAEHCADELRAWLVREGWLSPSG